MTTNQLIRQRESLRLTEVALEAGVSYPTVTGWRKRYDDFPKPVRTEGRQMWFDRDEIDAFLRQHNLGVRYEKGRTERRGRRPHRGLAALGARVYEQDATS